MSYEQVIRLFRLIENGSEEARNKVIVHNLRLPINIAKRYRGKGVSFYDLIQYGNLGLMKAVDKYDYKKGYRFSTYATWWIRQSIDRAIKDECYTVRLPVHKHDIIHKIKKFAEQYYLKYGFEPTDYILIKNGFSRENVDIYNSIKNGGFVLSLDMPIINEDGESDLTLGDRVASEIDDYGEFMNEKLLKDFKRDFNNSQLPEKDKLVLAYRYGLYDGKTRTLEEVGEIFHLTRERIRQIESRALKKLAKIKSIKSYGEEFGLVLKK